MSDIKTNENQSVIKTPKVKWYKRKGIVISLVCAILLVFVAAYFIFFRPGSNENKVYVESVSTISSNSTISGSSNRYTGVVEPQSTKNINADSAKTVESIEVKVGDIVKAGDILFTYSVKEMEYELEQLNLDLQAIQNQINSGEYSGAMLDNLYLDRQAKQNEIANKKSDIQNAYVTSPIDGVVKTINENQTNNYYGSDNSFITIVAEGDFVIKAKVSELSVKNLYVGAPVVIRSRVDENEHWSGSITSIDTSNTASGNNNDNYFGSNGDSASQYYFYVSLEETEGLIMGQHITVELSDGANVNAKGVLLTEYYIVDADTDNPYVWIESNGRLKKSYVTLGDYNDLYAEYDVISGLEFSDYIAFPQDDFKEGMSTVHQADYSVY